jgi:hypothetical protein
MVSEISEFAVKAVFARFRASITICGEVNMQIGHSLGYLHLGRGPSLRSSARTICLGLMVSAAPLRQPKLVKLCKLLECYMPHVNAEDKGAGRTRARDSAILHQIGAF